MISKNLKLYIINKDQLIEHGVQWFFSWDRILAHYDFWIIKNSGQSYLKQFLHTCDFSLELCFNVPRTLQNVHKIIFKCTLFLADKLFFAHTAMIPKNDFKMHILRYCLSILHRKTSYRTVWGIQRMKSFWTFVFYICKNVTSALV